MDEIYIEACLNGYYPFSEFEDEPQETKVLLIILDYKFNNLTNITYEKNSRNGYVSRIVDGLQ